MSHDRAELFTLKCAAITADLSRVSDETQIRKQQTEIERAADALIAPHLSRADFPIQSSAKRMAEFYEIFYILENDIRSFVKDTMSEAFGDSWWNSNVPEDVRRYSNTAKDKESREGLPPRSKDLIDYVTFGHLGEIIKSNWNVFAGLFPNCEIERLEKVIARLNMARGPIAHCGYLPRDEVVRLKLAIRDWYSLSE